MYCDHCEGRKVLTVSHPIKMVSGMRITKEITKTIQVACPYCADGTKVRPPMGLSWKKRES